MIQDLVDACEWDIGKYIIFSDNVFSPLIYYSHLTPIIVSLVFGLYIYFSNRRSLLNKILLFVTILLSLWLLLDLVLWATDSTRMVMFAWSTINIIEPAIYAGFAYFAMVFATGKDVSSRTKLFLTLPLFPTFILGATTWNVLGFNLTNCDREVIEGPVAYYNYFIEILYSLWILSIGVWFWIRRKGEPLHRQSLFVVAAILVLLFGFASGNIIGSFSEDWSIGQYGLFVIPVSIGTLSYIVIQLKFINRNQIMAAQVLVIGLLLSVGSILFIQKIVYVRWIVGATLFLLAVLGYILINSFKYEIKQRKEIEELAKKLEEGNRQQIILIHFITHQIKGYLTKSRNIFSLALDGDLGPISETLKPMLEEGLRSDAKGINTIQEILNAANIKSGKVSYVKSALDIDALVREIVRDLEAQAAQKALALNITSVPQEITVNGDRAQLTQAIRNLIDNSIKYTLSGKVTVSVSKSEGRARIEIADTGVGITKEDMQKLFTEGGHGKDSQKVNVESTGFGLYIVKNIIEAHDGKVWAESEGAGKGSRFIVELPA